MRPVAERTDLAAVSDLRDRGRRAARAQIVRDSILPRGLGEAWVVRVGDEVTAYGAVWVDHYPGRVFEYETAEGWGTGAGGFDPLFACLVGASGATHVEWQTNLAGADRWAGLGTDARVDHLLFEDGKEGVIPEEGAVVRPRRADDDARGSEFPEGEWVVEIRCEPVGAGGILTHYNPPFGDLYMAVVPSARGQGAGASLVRALRARARARGLVPAARCDPANEASRKTLLRGGMRECGRLLSARIAPLYRDPDISARRTV